METRQRGRKIPEEEVRPDSRGIQVRPKILQQEIGKEAKSSHQRLGNQCNLLPREDSSKWNASYLSEGWIHQISLCLFR